MARRQHAPHAQRRQSDTRRALHKARIKARLVAHGARSVPQQHHHPPACQRGAEGGGREGGDQGDGARHLTAEQQPHQHVAAEFVGSQGMAGTGGAEPRQQIDLVAVDPEQRLDQGCRARGQGQQDDQHPAGQGHAVLGEAPRREPGHGTHCPALP